MEFHSNWCVHVSVRFLAAEVYTYLNMGRNDGTGIMGIGHPKHNPWLPDRVINQAIIIDHS